DRHERARSQLADQALPDGGDGAAAARAGAGRVPDQRDLVRARQGHLFLAAVLAPVPVGLLLRRPGLAAAGPCRSGLTLAAPGHRRRRARPGMRVLARADVSILLIPGC